MQLHCAQQGKLCRAALAQSQCPGRPSCTTACTAETFQKLQGAHVLQGKLQPLSCLRAWVSGSEAAFPSARGHFLAAA